MPENYGVASQRRYAGMLGVGSLVLGLFIAAPSSASAQVSTPPAPAKDSAAPAAETPKRAPQPSYALSDENLCVAMTDMMKNRQSGSQPKSNSPKPASTDTAKAAAGSADTSKSAAGGASRTQVSQLPAMSVSFMGKTVRCKDGKPIK